MTDDGKTRTPFRVMMWSSPRSVSTAITKCLSFIDRDNTKVFFGPYCLRKVHEVKARVNGWYPEVGVEDEFDVDFFLSTNYAKLKGSPLGVQFDPAHVDKSLVTRKAIAQQLNTVPRDQSVFVKDVPLGITGHYHQLPDKYSGYKYTFLIRDPERVFPSLRELLFQQAFMSFGNDVTKENFDVIADTPYMEDGYFYKSQYELWRFVKENIDPNPVVVDSEDILAHPAEMLPKFCDACGIPWKDSLLSWDASPVIAESWRVIYPLVIEGTQTSIEDCAHASALTSSGFNPAKPKRPFSELTPDVIRAIEATKGYYAEMAKTRIRTTSDVVTS